MRTFLSFIGEVVAELAKLVKLVKLATLMKVAKPEAISKMHAMTDCPIVHAPDRRRIIGGR